MAVTGIRSTPSATSLHLQPAAKSPVAAASTEAGQTTSKAWQPGAKASRRLATPDLDLPPLTPAQQRAFSLALPSLVKAEAALTEASEALRAANERLMHAEPQRNEVSPARADHLSARTAYELARSDVAEERTTLSGLVLAKLGGSDAVLSGLLARIDTCQSASIHAQGALTRLAALNPSLSSSKNEQLTGELGESIADLNRHLALAEPSFPKVGLPGSVTREQLKGALEAAKKFADGAIQGDQRKLDERAGAIVNSLISSLGR